jgi:D-alanyl-lipoteichoic acid acyltransferase DltB (MBOAT superfamily)
MTLTNILIALAITLFAALILRPVRTYSIMVISIFFLYWLQPDVPTIIHEFWLATTMLGFIVLCWVVVTPPEERGKRQNIITVLVMITPVIILDVVSRLPELNVSLIIPPPTSWQPAITLSIFVLIAWGLFFLPDRKSLFLSAIILFIVVIFILLKLPVASNRIAGFLVKLAILQGVESTGNIPPIGWFGFSYVAFRLIHTLRDRQIGKIIQVGLAEYITYVIFFPTLTAGPIDRIERFLGDLRNPLPLDTQAWLDSGRRLAIGLFKKFFVANSLVIFSLGTDRVIDVHSPGWMWVYLYAYTLMIYFDFSGYTDIVIGLGRLSGFKIPENFSAPYFKPNITQFWNNWHMTLTQWFRAYFFNPLTRALRSQQKAPPVWAVILITQTFTMVLIGLWHGVTINYFLWGIWHGLGLFIQNRWSDTFGGRIDLWANTQIRKQSLRIISTLLTFHFVALGWIFFAVPQLPRIKFVFLRLFGLY